MVPVLFGRTPSDAIAAPPSHLADARKRLLGVDGEEDPSEVKGSRSLGSPSRFY
jgi:hypothetical protein